MVNIFNYKYDVDHENDKQNKNVSFKNQPRSVMNGICERLMLFFFFLDYYYYS